MPWWSWLLIAIFIVLLAVFFFRLWTLAVRIDRLHRRVVNARSGLGRLMVKRASDSLQIGTSGLLAEDEAKIINQAARAALDASESPVADDDLGMSTTPPDGEQQNGSEGGVVKRYVIESELSSALRETLDSKIRQNLVADPWGASLLDKLDSTSYRLKVTRTMHNQDVSQVREIRAKLLARMFHLAGFAPLPGYIDFDDAIQ